LKRKIKEFGIFAILDCGTCSNKQWWWANWWPWITLNYQSIGFSRFLRFLVVVHNWRVNCIEVAADRLRQPANRNC